MQHPTTTVSLKSQQFQMVFQYVQQQSQYHIQRLDTFTTFPRDSSSVTFEPSLKPARIRPYHLRRLKVHGGFLFTSWSFTYKKRFKNGATPSYLPISNCIKPSWTYRGMHLLPQYARRSAFSKGAAETWEKCCVGSKTAAALNAVRLLFKCAIVTRGKKEGKAC